MPSSSGRNGYQYDRERVVTDDLAVVLERFIKDWLAERPEDETAIVSYGYARAEDRYMGPIAYIAERTGLADRRISGIIARETYTTSYYMADLILTKIHMGHRIDDLRIVPDSAIIRGNGATTKHFKSNEEWLEYLDSIGCRR